MGKILCSELPEVSFENLPGENEFWFICISMHEKYFQMEIRFNFRVRKCYAEKL